MAPTWSKPGRTAFQESADWSARRNAPCWWDASHFEEAQMKRIQASIAAGVLGLALAGCSGMSHQEKSTIAGAAIGGIAGSALTNGSGAGTVGGAVVGGVVGHEVGKR
jgi:osmotically inducible lipoprotein OsmB